MKQDTYLPSEELEASWNPDNFVQKRKPILRVLAYIGVGFVSFLFFIYFTFPYDIIKEVLISKLSQELMRADLPIRVSIESLRPSWITGIAVDNAVFAHSTQKDIVFKLDAVRLRWNPFSLILGRLSFSVFVQQEKGVLTVSAVVPLMSLVTGAPGLQSLDVVSKDFHLDRLFDYGLAIVKSSKSPAMLLLMPLLSKTSAGGALNGMVTLRNPEVKNFAKAVGDIKLNLKSGFLHIDDDTLKIPKQNFKDATFDIKYENNLLVFGDSTRLASEHLELGVNGQMTFPTSPSGTMTANLNLKMVMRGEVEKSLGFIVPNMLRCDPLKDGVLKAKLSGPLSSMSCQTL